MTNPFSQLVFCLISFSAMMLLGPGSMAAGSSVTINADHVLEINGKKVFPIGFTMPPPPDGRTPDGKNGIQELAEAGATFLRTGCWSGPWDDRTIQQELRFLDAAARHGLYCMPYLREHASIRSDAGEKKLRDLINRFKHHPGLGAWKGVDEPEWNKEPLAPLLRAHRVIKELDPHHPLVIIHAPRGTVDSLRPYNAIGDIIGADIYPISYPPGIHSTLPNKEISLVGDHTRIMMEVAAGQMPVWMVLQIAWSGVARPEKTLRFPTFPEERFMVYQAIINGARGLIFFGGTVKPALSPEDAELGWNWTFWKRVLRPVIEEIGSRSPLYPALLAPNSRLPITVSGEGVEFCVREAGDELFILACRREGPTSQVEFSGLPAAAGEGEVMFESPRRVQARDGRFTDWFAPFEAHVYRFKR